MFSAAIVGDYYGYNSIVTQDKRVRRMRRTELSAGKLIRCKLQMVSGERNASLKTADLIRVNSLQSFNENKKNNLGSGQDRVKRRVYQQRIIQQEQHCRSGQRVQKTNVVVMTNSEGIGLMRKDKTGYFKSQTQQEKGLMKKHGRNKIQKQKQPLPKQVLDLQSPEEEVPTYCANQTTEKRTIKQDNYLNSYGFVPVTTNLVVPNKKVVAQNENSEKGLGDRKRLAITKETDEQNIPNDGQTGDKNNQIKVGGLDFSQNIDDAIPSKSSSEIFPKKSSKLQTVKLSKSLTPSDYMLLNKDEHILIEEVEVAEKSKLRDAHKNQTRQPGVAYEIQEGCFGCTNRDIQTADDLCEKVPVQMREETGKFVCGSGSNIRITIKSAETADSQQIFAKKVHEPNIVSKEKRQPSICNLLLQSKENDKPDCKSKRLGEVALVSEGDAVIMNRVGVKKSPLIVEQGVSQPSFQKKLLSKGTAYNFQTVLKKIQQHDTRIGFLYRFVLNTKNAYPGKLKYERYQRLCFLMLKKYLLEKQRMIKSLKGEETCFILTGISLPTEAIRPYANYKELQKPLLALMKQQREIFQELEKEFHRIAHKYAKDVYMKLEITRDIFEKEVMKLLMEELSRLYGQLQGEETDTEQIDCTEQRFVEIVETMFLLSELSGRQVKAFTLLSDDLVDFETYYSQNYQKIMETTEYFQQL